MEPKDVLLSRMEDLADKAVKSGCSASRFLSPAEAQSVDAHFTRGRDVKLLFDGGTEDAERTRAVFLNPDWGEYERSKWLTVLKIEYRSQNTPGPGGLGHRDVLGALMALGMERDTVGDIICGDGYAVLLCVPEMGGYIIENLTKAGRVGVHISEIGLEQVPAGQEELTVKTDTVASLRLDAVLCAAFGLSRAKASELIDSERVSVDHQLCSGPAKELTEGVLLSVRGLGRAKLLEVGGVSRKGRIFIRIGLL